MNFYFLDQKNNQHNSEIKKNTNDSLFTIYQAAGPGIWLELFVFFFACKKLSSNIFLFRWI